MTQSIAELEDIARSALARQDESRAAGILGAWLKANGPSSEILHWQAMLLRALDRRGDAIAALTQAAFNAPNDARIAQALAQVTLEAGQPAAGLFETALRLAPTSSEVRLGLISAYYAEGRGEAALQMLAGALAANPGWVEGHHQYAQLATMLGRAEQALGPLLDAVARFPDAIALRIDAVKLLLAARRFAQAVELSDGIGGDPQLLVAQAAALDEMGDAVRAASLFEQLEPPRDASTAAWMARHFLRRGQPEKVADCVRPWLAGEHSYNVWPYVALAWRLLGDDRADWLEHQPGLIKVYDLADRDLDLPRLAVTLRTIHAASGRFLDQSIEGGTQTDGALFARTEPDIVALRSAMARAMERHIAGLPPGDPDHPQLSQALNRPLRFSGSWSVRLTGQGYHRSHHHPQGWFSAVLYLTVPDGLQQTEGQLALGGSPPELDLGLAPFAHIAPKPGRLVVFPSTTWHATESFTSGERMTVAFDLARPFEES